MNNQFSEVNKIRSKYISREQTDVERLRRLDKQVKKPAQIFAYVFGVIAVLVLGTGMCFAMSVIEGSMILGIVIGVLGIGLVCVNYPMYKTILESRRKKYSEKIISLSDEILGK